VAGAIAARTMPLIFARIAANADIVAAVKLNGILHYLILSVDP